jgi:hypothetical protein
MTRGGMDGCPAVALDLQFHPLHVRPDASALIVYVTLSLSAVWQHRLLKLLTAEAAQGILRFTEPLLPAEYLTNTRVAAAFLRRGSWSLWEPADRVLVRSSHQRHILRIALRPAAWTHFASECDFGCACGHGLIPLSHLLRRRAPGDAAYRPDVPLLALDLVLAS